MNAGAVAIVVVLVDFALAALSTVIMIVIIIAQ